MSAILGQDWRPKTLRELFLQYEYRIIENWHHTAHIKSCLAGDKNTRYEDLHPYLNRISTRAVKVEPKSLWYEELSTDTFFDKMFGEGTAPNLDDINRRIAEKDY